MRPTRAAPSEPVIDEEAPEVSAFLPFKIEGAVSAPAIPLDIVSLHTLDGAVLASLVDITLSDSRRISVQRTTKVQGS